MHPRYLLVLVVLLGAALRLYPFWVPYMHPEQELLPKNALVAFVDGNWRPTLLHHGSGVLYALRTIYTGWYALGRAAGWYQDRLDVLAGFVRDPLPFLILARLFVAGTGILSIVLVARLARALHGSWSAGIAAALFLSVTLIHVRGSHHVWQDVPAATAVLASVAAALHAQRRPGRRWICATGALAGIALASKHSMFPVALVVLVAVGVTPAPAWRERGMRLLLAGAAATASYLVLSPYTLLSAASVFFLLKWQGQMFAAQSGGLALSTLLRVGLGTAVPLLAVAGLLVAARKRPTATLLVGAFPIAYLQMLAAGSLVYARYLAPLAPFAALFAGIGVAALGRLAPRRLVVTTTSVLALLVAAGPLRASLGYDRVLAERDTRQLAGDWLRTHVAPGTSFTLHTAHGYSNPVLPLGAAQVRRFFPRHAEALLARGLGTAAADYPVRYVVGIFGQSLVRDPEHWVPQDRWIVLGRHPRLPQAGASDPTFFETALLAAGAKPVARFASVVGDPQATVYDPIDADFTPLAGFSSVERPGPEMTIWKVPALAVDSG